MTKEELEKATGQELIDERDYCGVDGYYGDYLDNVNAEMLKRFNRLAELEAQIEKMKCCGNCRFGYCERSSEYIDKDGNRTFHCWNEEKEKYCDVGKNGKYQCWEIKEK